MKKAHGFQKTVVKQLPHHETNNNAENGVDSVKL